MATFTSGSLQLSLYLHPLTGSTSPDRFSLHYRSNAYCRYSTTTSPLHDNLATQPSCSITFAIDFNRHPAKFGYDGQAELHYEARVEHHGFPMPSIPAPQYGFPPNFAAPYGGDYQRHLNVHDTMPMPDHLDLGPAIPESPAYEAPTPRELLHVQDIYDAYVASYNDDITPQSVRMEIAQALALALLSHYYPESEGYVLQPSSLGPMAEHGMNFILKAPDGSDPDYMAPEPAPLPPVPVRKDPKKGKKFRPKPPSKARIAALMKVQAEEEYKRQFNSYWPFTVGLTWHQIEPEDISGYVVLKKYTTSNNGIEKVEYRLHTCLAIVLAPPDLLPQIAGTNDVQRGDILTDALSRSQQIRHGHGILLFGMWLELYDFDNGAGTTITGDVEAKYQEGTVSYEEPRVTMSQSADGQRLALDMRNAGLSVVDEVCRMVVQNEVVPTKEHSAEVGEIGMSGGYGGGS